MQHFQVRKRLGVLVRRMRKVFASRGRWSNLRKMTVKSAIVKTMEWTPRLGVYTKGNGQGSKPHINIKKSDEKIVRIDIED